MLSFIKKFFKKEVKDQQVEVKSEPVVEVEVNGFDQKDLKFKEIKEAKPKKKSTPAKEETPKQATPKAKKKVVEDFDVVEKPKKPRKSKTDK